MSAPDFRRLFEASPSRDLLLGRDLTIVAASDGWLQAARAERSAVVGRALFDVTGDDPVVRASLARVVETGRPDTIPGRAVHTPLADAGGVVEHILQRLTDDTRRDEERFRLAADAIDGIVYEQDLLTGHVARSLGLAEIVGWRNEEVDATAEWWLAQIHPDDRAQLVRDLHRLLDSGDRHTARYRVRHRDGHWLHLVDRLMVIRDASGRALRLVGCSQDVSALVRVEEQARRLAAIVEATPDFVAVGTMDGRVLYMNRAGRRMVGIPDDAELASIRHETLCPPWVFEKTQREWLPAALRDGAATGDGALLTRDGAEIPVSFVMLIHRDASGAPELVATMARDVSERKRVEEELAAIVDSMTEGLTVATPDGHIVLSNATALAIHGYSSVDEMVRHLAEDPAPFLVWDLDGRALPVEAWPFARALRGETFSGQEIRVRRKDSGVEYIGSYNGAPVRDRDGRVARAIVTVRDVTALRRDEEALRRRERELRMLAENMPALVARFDRDLRHLYVNRQVTALTGIPAARFLGRTNGELGFDPSLYTDGEARMREVFATGQEATSELTFPTADGPRHLSSWFGPERNDAGEIESVLCITRDVTAQKRLEHELRRRMAELADADRRKDEFLATLAHELRNPLAPLRNGLELLRRGDADDGTADRARGMMERQLAHMVRLIDDLLDVSRITRGKLQLRRERVALAPIVQAAIETSRPTIDAGRHALTVEVTADPIELEADATRLAQVVANLLSNAAKYTDPGGHITLTAARDGDQVVIAVRDDGIGIAAEHLPGLFEIFFQVSPAIERSQDRLDIGLSLVRGLVELHGGTVHARSDGPGRGSEFTVRLPIAAAHPLRSPAAEEGGAASLGAARRVLIVDDNVDAAETLAMVLELDGHRVDVAHDGPRGLRLAEEARPEVVLLDIGLPKMNGYEVARHIRRQPWGAAMTLVAVTGWGQEDDKRRATEAGFDLHLTKPIAPEALRRMFATPHRR